MKCRASVNLLGIDRQRRDFLFRCCQGASFALVPRPLWSLILPNTSSVDSRSESTDATEFHFQPHYRTERSLDATLLKVHAGLDDFITEKYAAQIGTILEQWSSSLRKSPLGVGSIESFLAPEFSGNSLHPVASRATRGGKALEVHRNEFGQARLVLGLRTLMYRPVAMGFSQLST